MKANICGEIEHQLDRERRLKSMRARKLAVLKQKVMGLILIAICVVAPVLLDGDATASVLLLPIGLYLVGCNTEIR